MKWEASPLAAGSSHMAYYRDGQWYHPCTQQDTRAHMPFTHYIPASRLPDLWV